MLSANNPDVVDKLEGLVALWSKVIEQVLAESEQVGCRLLFACTCSLTSHFNIMFAAQDSGL